MESTTLLLAFLALLFVAVLLFLCLNRRGSGGPSALCLGPKQGSGQDTGISRADELRIKQALLDAAAAGSFSAANASSPEDVARGLAAAFSLVSGFAKRSTGS